MTHTSLLCQGAANVANPCFAYVDRGCARPRFHRSHHGRVKPRTAFVLFSTTLFRVSNHDCPSPVAQRMPDGTDGSSIGLHGRRLSAPTAGFCLIRSIRPLRSTCRRGGVSSKDVGVVMDSLLQYERRTRGSSSERSLCTLEGCWRSPRRRAPAHVAGCSSR